MRDEGDIYYTDFEIDDITGVSDLLLLSQKCNNKINIISCECNPCITSYYLTSDACSKILCIYGCIVTKVTYLIGKECTRCTQMFLKTFNKCIKLPEVSGLKIRSATVNMEHKYFKKFKEVNVMAYYTLKIKIYLKGAATLYSNNQRDKGFSDLDCRNTINIEENNCVTDFEEKCCNHNTFEKHSDNCNINKNNCKKDSFNRYEEDINNCPKNNELNNDWLNSVSNHRYYDRH